VLNKKQGRPILAGQNWWQLGPEFKRAIFTLIWAGKARRTTL